MYRSIRRKTPQWPAALATMLSQRGIDATPDALVEQVYIPQRRQSTGGNGGCCSLRRAAGLPAAPSSGGCLTEIASGNPVLVLQNLAFDRYTVAFCRGGGIRS